MYILSQKVFISYDDPRDQYYKQFLINLDEKYNLFTKLRVRDPKFNYNFKPETKLITKIREEIIEDSTVLILLCGQNTKYSKSVELEIRAALEKNNDNLPMGILVINLPQSKNLRYIKGELDKFEYLHEDGNIRLNDPAKYHENYQELPDIILNCIIDGNDITVVNWTDIYFDPVRLKHLINNAHRSRANFGCECIFTKKLDPSEN